MRKIYVLSIAAAVSLTASAITRQQAAGTPLNVLSATAERIHTMGNNAVAKVPAKVSDFNSVTDVAGKYEWSYYGLMDGGSDYKTGVITLTVLDKETGLIQIDGIFSSETGISGSVKGTVDLTEGTLTVPNKQYLGADCDGFVNYFYFKFLDYDGYAADGAADVESVVATIEGSTFIFPEEYVFAVGNFDDEDLGWWQLTASNQFTMYSKPDDLPDLSEWSAFTTATLLDGWILPAFTYTDGSYVDPEDFPLTVSVARNNENANLLLIENPYLRSSGFPVDGASEGYIVLDITDPEFVLVMPEVFSGYTNGTERVYCFNIEGFYADYGYTKEDIIDNFNGEIEEWSTMTEENGNTIISIPTCRFNFPSALNTMYTWTNRADAMKATIILNGTVDINDVIISNDINAPVEYFTTQGVRIANPQNGSIVIRRQGTQVSKIIVK